MMMALAWPESYGAWAGKPNGTKPDFSRCAAEVSEKWSRWGMQSQCARKATCDRNSNGDFTACKQHSAAAVKKRAIEQELRDAKRDVQHCFDYSSRRYYEALKLIADGHNDPRTVAREAIAELERRKERLAELNLEAPHDQ